VELGEILIHRYALRPTQAPNRLSSKALREGALLRVYFPHLKSFGHADLFVWPELGDATLPQELKALKDVPFRAGAAALAWAQYEARAVAQGLSLYDATRTIPSHQTLTGRDEVAATAAKLKISAADVRQWKEVEAYCLRHPGVRWRFDFNALFEHFEDAQKFWQKVSPELKARTDFLEDLTGPALMHSEELHQLVAPTRLALDRGLPEIEDLLWVIKPTTFAPDYLFDEVRAFPGQVVLTSNMDHPLGQLQALHFAQRLHKVAPKQIFGTGLCTQDVYETHAASHWLETRDQALRPTVSSPIGWPVHLELEKLSWSTL